MNRHLSLLFISLLIGCGNIEFQSHWQTQRLNIDGDARDWEGVHLEYIEDLSMVIGIVNDDSTLSLMFRFSDAALARLFEMRGVTMWIDSTAVNRKVFGIRYHNHFMIVDAQSKHRRVPNDSQQPLTHKRKFSVIAGEEEVQISSSGISGIEAADDIQEGLYVFEFRIPLWHTPIKNQILTIGIDVPGIKEEIHEQKGLRAGGRRGRGRGVGSNNRKHLPHLDGKEKWFAVRLAQNI